MTRGRVSMPDRWTKMSTHPPKKSRSSRFSPAGAKALAEAASREAASVFGRNVASVSCRCASRARALSAIVAACVPCARARLRYVGVAGGESEITWESELVFEWNLELPDGQRDVADVQNRAADAFDRGVHVPDQWAELYACLPEASASSTFTATAARELAKEASRKARHALSGDCVSVTCTCAFPTLCTWRLSSTRARVWVCVCCVVLCMYACDEGTLARSAVKL